MRPDGVGASALKYWETRQEVAANNLANVSTPGFKGERVFARMMEDATVRLDSGTDFTAGSLNPTGRPLDIAMAGDGFLVVDTAEGERWIRGGSLAMDESGQLVDSNGRPVLGDGGPIVIPPGPIEITPEGTLMMGNASVGQLRIERAEAGASLVRDGANLWVPSAGKEKVLSSEQAVSAGHLEGSNVSPVTAMVEMIEIQRAYQAIQKSLVARDSVMTSITSEIGRVG